MCLKFVNFACFQIFHCVECNLYYLYLRSAFIITKITANSVYVGVSMMKHVKLLLLLLLFFIIQFKIICSQK